MLLSTLLPYELHECRLPLGIYALVSGKCGVLKLFVSLITRVGSSLEF